MGKNEKVVPLNNTQDEASSKIEIIKNLIFGENIKTYDSEFESLKKDILDKKRVLEELIEEVRQDLKTAIDNVATDVNIRITELEDKIEDKIESLETEKVNKKMLGKLLIDLGEKVSEK
ncbi:fructose 1,6-bisphosphatase [Euzebyella marina]|uniref:Fructose 1,6-bisphosphatase n=1 Tax=Euzebyella marina TaxID=1761453 RepID=A0A3G2L118_9FLAO|nr:fructose 1,6-bisphosphatase [Euzebyella marina]AYN65947.1 fructose 1,6-bisphosphatase [Euzebyella marina]MAU71266.1 fructose 1,6-bisphosphatase [Pseudozobellia sp.]MBG46666.1 fructose 1,6-bisphosphatase [Pseudozobellia sp.]MBG49337.1 fructose 1,6-bisphosphatase [Pseudozobellia sp.]|tara:strand:- start:5330 stop:5686 length:357 start_codon:yes stop_codon:yes gene_type:complete